jgi:acyl carrier protein
MMERNEILNNVVSAVRDLVETFPEVDRFEISEQTVLFGQNSQIDSLSLVSVVVDLETLFYDRYNLELSLTDDRAMTRTISPFESVKNLVDYIHELIAEMEKKNHG